MALNVEEVSKINNNGEDTPIAVVWPSQLERCVKHSVIQMACIMEKTALRETHNPTADSLVPGHLMIRCHEGESESEGMIC